MLKRKKIFYGWWMVIASGLLVFLDGSMHYGFTVFFNPIRQTFGWTAAVTSIAFTIRRLEGGIVSPLSGFLLDKLGPRKMMLFGWIVVGLGYFLMSRIDSLWTFYGTFLLVGIGISFGSVMIVNVALSHWFVKKRSRAITLVYIISGTCGIVVPLLNWLIIEYGWRDALVIISITMWVIGLPLCSLMRHKPSQYGYLPDGEKNETVERLDSNSENSSPQIESVSAREALKMPVFWLLTLAFLFQQMGTSSIYIHLVPYLESVQFPTVLAATVVTGMTLSSLLGRLAFGLIGDFTDKRYLLAISLA
ncbi:MFS transporter, partial [Chloroflexota bacterium]